MKQRVYLLPLLLLFTLLLHGCASKPPAALRNAPEHSPTLSQVHAQPKAYLDKRLRWGGSIAGVENLPQTTRIEIVARRLYDSGEPISGDSSEGRFLAHFDQFLDPSIYSVGRSITVVGTLARIEQRELDQMHYRYPVISVESHHLWPEPEPYQEPYYDPFWHDPFFYDPWYPFGYPYPYYPHRYPRPHRH
ncbi:MAG: Slp family lipoprotein [Pseudomonadota bacterium]